MKRTTLLMLTLLAASDAQAQQRTFYGADGRVTGHETTSRDGSTTIYGADGRVTGRTSTDSQGTTTVYGADGRKAGTVASGPLDHGEHPLAANRQRLIGR